MELVATAHQLTAALAPGPDGDGRSGASSRSHDGPGRRGLAGSPARPAGRPLHPWAWWAWALGVAVAASLSSNPLFLLLLCGTVLAVVLVKRGDSPWARAIWAYLVLAGVVVAIRVVFIVVAGSGGAGTELFRLPTLPLPDWATGISLGGPVHAERLLSTAYDAMRLGMVLVAVGAANALANPKRALRSVPSALYDVSVAVVIALTVAPQLVQSTIRVRRARRLRGGRVTGLRAVRALAIPVLEDAVDRSLALAAAMEVRGYGRTRSGGDGSTQLAGPLMVTGLVLLTLGSYLLLSGQVTTGWAVGALVLGGLNAAAGMVVSGQRLSVTRYRPDRWATAEWLVLASGVTVALATAYWATQDPAALGAPSGLTWPDLPLPYLGLLAVVAVPALAAPRPPAMSLAAPWAVGR